MHSDADERTSLPPGVPEHARPFLDEVGYLQPDSLSVGDAAPRVPFYTTDGEQIYLDRFHDRSAVVLVFGSHT